MPAIIGCTDPDRTYVKLKYEPLCDPSTVEQRSSFVLRCIKNGNPVSDEEPEDWIPLCQEMAEEVYCPLVAVYITKKCGSSSGCNWIEVSRKVKPYPEVLND